MKTLRNLSIAFLVGFLSINSINALSTSQTTYSTSSTILTSLENVDLKEIAVDPDGNIYVEVDGTIYKIPASVLN